MQCYKYNHYNWLNHSSQLITIIISYSPVMKQQEIMTKNQKNLANIEEVRLKMESSTHDAAKTFADYFHTMEKIKVSHTIRVNNN